MLTGAGEGGDGWSGCVGEGVLLSPGWMSALSQCVLSRSGLCEREEPWKDTFEVPTLRQTEGVIHPGAQAQFGESSEAPQERGNAQDPPLVLSISILPRHHHL